MAITKKATNKKLNRKKAIILKKNTSRKINKILPPDKLQELVQIARDHKIKVASYPEELKILAMSLKACGRTYKSIAETFGVGEGTVHGWINDTRLDPIAVSQVSDAVKRNMASKMYVSSNSILSAISDQDVEKASLLQKASSIGILVDKARLIEGHSTENVEMIYTRRNEVNTRESDIKKEIERRKRSL